MQEKQHICRNGQQGTVQTADSYKELQEAIGKEQALSYANRGWLIAQQASIRLAGQESKTAKLKKALAILKDNPDTAKELGIDLEEL